MFSLTVAAFLSALPIQADTVVNLGQVERDLTGDGQPEILRLVGEGPSVDSLEVIFSIESSGRVLFRTALAPLTRTVGFDAGRRTVSAAEHRARLDEFGDWFFDDRKFNRPDEFIEWLRESARDRIPRIPEAIDRYRRWQLVVDSLVAAGNPLVDAERRAPFPGPSRPDDLERATRIWAEIQRAGVPIFVFSEGGDGLTAIAWSARDRRFHRLLECC